MMLILFINEKDFKIYSMRRTLRQLLDIRAYHKHHFRERTVLEYRDFILNNNYNYLYDYSKKLFFFRKTRPIQPGTLIIDIVHNKLNNVNSSCQIESFDLQNSQPGVEFTIQGKYGKRMLDLGKKQHVCYENDRLSNHLAFFFVHLAKNKQKFKGHLIINNRF